MGSACLPLLLAANTPFQDWPERNYNMVMISRPTNLGLLEAAGIATCEQWSRSR